MHGKIPYDHECGGVNMRKILIASILALVILIVLLNYLGVIDFGILYVFSRCWFVIPMWYGVRFFREPERSKRISGFVLLVFSGFMLMLNIIELITDTQDFIYYITVIGTLVFWPIVIIALFVAVIISLLDKGEVVHKSVFTVKSITSPNTEILDLTLRAIGGKLTYIIQPEAITHRTVRLDVFAFLGKVEIIIPEDVGVLAEAKSRFSVTQIIGQRNQKLFGNEVIRSAATLKHNPRLLLVTGSWLGSVTVKCE
mgnify:CR=1 FL=1